MSKALLATHVTTAPPKLARLHQAMMHYHLPPCGSLPCQHVEVPLAMASAAAQLANVQALHCVVCWQECIAGMSMSVAHLQCDALQLFTCECFCEGPALLPAL